MAVKNKAVLNILKFSLLAFLVVSCATTSSNSASFFDIDNAVSQGDYRAAIDAIVRGQSGNRVIYNERNAISLFLDKGLLEYYSGNYAASSNDLQNAERLIEEAYTRSITQGFLSYIVNDNTKDYPGEDFENIYLNVFNALNYFNRGNLEGALVEIRKLSGQSGKLELLARRHEYTDPNTGASLNEMTRRETGITQMPDTIAVNFSNSALARYLGALFFQAARNTESARIEFDQIQRAFSANRTLYRHPIPRAVSEAQNVPSGTARLNLISFTGLSPIKQERHTLFYLPFQHPILRVVSFKLPVLVRRSSVINRIEVVVDGKSFNMELLEDISAVIEETYNARSSNILLKTYIRTIIKYVVADIASMEATRQSGELAGVLIAAAARTALEISENADTRMARFLPDKAYIGGINLDPGTYTVIINYYQGNRLISSDVLATVIVRQDRLNLLQSVNLR